MAKYRSTLEPGNTVIVAVNGVPYPVAGGLIVDDDHPLIKSGLGAWAFEPVDEPAPKRRRRSTHADSEADSE